MLLFISPALQASELKEVQLGFWLDGKFIANQTVLFDPAVNQKISVIGNRIATAAGRSDFDYTFRVIVDPTINAYSSAGGFVYINTGLLDVLESEDEVAAVIAHEIAHTNQKHQLNKIYAQNVKEIGTYTLGAILSAGMMMAGVNAVGPEVYSNLDPKAKQSFLQLSENLGLYASNCATFAMVQGYGRSQELEADKLAAQYLPKAGYDPQAMVHIFKKLIVIRDKLGITEDNYLSSFINAEPGLEKRIDRLEEQ